MRSRTSVPGSGKCVKVETGMVTSYPTPPASTMAWLGCFSSKTPRSRAIITSLSCATRGELPGLYVAVGERQERRPVRRRRVAAAMLAKGHVPVDERRLDRGKLGGAHVFLAQKPVYRPRASRRQEHSFRIHPSI